MKKTNLIKLTGLCAVVACSACVSPVQQTAPTNPANYEKIKKIQKIAYDSAFINRFSAYSVGVMIRSIKQFDPLKGNCNSKLMTRTKNGIETIMNEYTNRVNISSLFVIKPMEKKAFNAVVKNTHSVLKDVHYAASKMTCKGYNKE